MLTNEEQTKVEALEAVIDRLSPRDQLFGRDLINSAKRGRISEKQLYWVGVLTERVAEREAVEAAAPKVIDETGIRALEALFAKAKGAGLKTPRIRLVTEGGQRLVVKPAGPSSRYIGQLLVTDDQGYGGAYFGRISAGAFVATPAATPEVEAALVEMGKDPAATATAYGRRTSSCCFCGLELTDGRSIFQGYGPICAGKYGLPWGEERAPAGNVKVRLEEGETDAG
jgi:hypothetical protein